MSVHRIRGKKATKFGGLTILSLQAIHTLKILPINCSLSNNWVVKGPDCKRVPWPLLGRNCEQECRG